MIYLFDTTLRDGSQGEDISFSVEDKLNISNVLDRFGIDYIEAGWPGSNPKDIEFFLTELAIIFKFSSKLELFSHKSHVLPKIQTALGFTSKIACRLGSISH